MNLANLFFTQVVQKSATLKTCVSTQMQELINLLNDMIRNQAPWNDKAPSCGVFSQVGGDLAAKVTQEMSVTADTEQLKRIMEHLHANASSIVEYITALGGCVIRPIYSAQSVQYEIIQLGNYIPISYDFDGTLTGAFLFKKFQQNGKEWLLVEKHEYENKTHTVENTLYKLDGTALVKRSLVDTPQTENLTPIFSYVDVDRPFLIEFRSPATNKVDGSNVPYAILAPAINIIEDADKQYARMVWEQESGERRVFADSDLLAKRQSRDGDTETVKLGDTMGRMFVKLNGDGSDDGSKLKEHSPALRTAEQNEFFQQVLRRIELACNIGKGTISDLEAVQQTAAQFLGGQSMLYNTVNQLETELENKYYACAYVFDYMLRAYKFETKAGNISIQYDYSSRKDPMQEKQIALQEVANGLMTKWEYRMRFFDEDEETAKARAEEMNTGAVVPF